MLGLGRASEYAGWWSQGNNIKLSIPVATSVTQAVYQTPVFSWNSGIYNYNGVFQIPYGVSPTSYVNVSGYGSLSGFNNARYTLMLTVKLPWDSGLSSASGHYRYTIDNNASPAYDTGIQFQINSGAMYVNAGSINGSGGPNDGFALDGVYTDYTSNWLTVVWSQAETSSVYTNWSGTGTGSCYTRLAIYNTETGALIKKHDQATSIGSFPDISSMITNSGGTVYLDGGQTYNVTWDWSNADTTYPGILAGAWTSIGTMFDPETAKATDTTWLTTRPNNTIGTGKAWTNFQFTNYEYNSGTNYYWLTDTAGDLVVSQNNRQASLGAPANATVFNNSYSTTTIPKDKS